MTHATVRAAPLDTFTAADIVRELHEIRTEVEVIRTDGADTALAHRLGRVGEELAVVDEELAVQLAELEFGLRDAERQRAQAERLLADFPLAVLGTDPHGKVLDANPAAVALLHTPYVRLLGKPLPVFVEVEDRRVARNLLGDVLGGLGDVPLQTRLRIVPRHGEPVECQVSLARTSASRGAVVRWLLDPVDDELRDPAAPAPASLAALAALADLGRLGASAGDLQGRLGRVTELICSGLEAVTGASVSLGDPSEPVMVATSSAAAQSRDGAQWEAGDGPSGQAFRSGETAEAPGAFAAPLLLDGAVQGVLTCYGEPDEWFGSGRAAHQVLPYLRAVEALVRDSQSLVELSRMRAQLREALESRAVIDQAKGVVMAQRGCGPDEAFEHLVALGNAGRRKVREVAAQIVAQVVAQVTP